MATFSDVIRARFPDQYAAPLNNDAFLNEVIPPATLLRESLPGVFGGNATSQAAADAKILAVLDAMSDPDLETAETALEDLRSTLYDLLPAAGKGPADQAYVGTTTIVPGVSVQHVFGPAGSAHFCTAPNGKFGAFRSACREVLGVTPTGDFLVTL